MDEIHEIANNETMPLVSVTGLEDCEAEIQIWKLLVSDRCFGHERIPLSYKRYTLNEFANMKTMKYDQQVSINRSHLGKTPVGIFKRSWMIKHLKQIPSVVIVFIELNWNWSNQHFDANKQRAVKFFQTIRSTLSDKTRSKFVLVIVQNDSVDDESSGGGCTFTKSDVINSLCSQCQLSTRSLVTLSSTNHEKIRTSLSLLEKTVNELCQNYYHQRIKHVKSHYEETSGLRSSSVMSGSSVSPVDVSSPTPSSSVSLDDKFRIRFEMKCAFFNELRRDFHAALKCYIQAYDFIVKVRQKRLTNEIKCIGGLVSYKISALDFRTNLPREAISQFRRHLDNFTNLHTLESSLIDHEQEWQFHLFWQASQHYHFAFLFLKAVDEGNLPAIQTQHPGIYYEKAVDLILQYKQDSNRTHCRNKLERISNHSSIEMDDLNIGILSLNSNESEDLYIGQGSSQRLLDDWSVEKKLIECLDKAIAQLVRYKSPRNALRLNLVKCEQLLDIAIQNSSFEAICTTSTKVLHSYLPIAIQHYSSRHGEKNDPLIPLLVRTLTAGVKCSYLIGDICQYISLAVQLVEIDSKFARNAKNHISSFFSNDNLDSSLLMDDVTDVLHLNSLKGDIENRWKDILTSTLPTITCIYLKSRTTVKLSAVSFQVKFKQKLVNLNDSSSMHIQLDFTLKNNLSCDFEVKNVRVKYHDELDHLHETSLLNDPSKETFNPILVAMGSTVHKMLYFKYPLLEDMRVFTHRKCVLKSVEVNVRDNFILHSKCEESDDFQSVEVIPMTCDDVLFSLDETTPFHHIISFVGETFEIPVNLKWKDTNIQEFPIVRLSASLENNGGQEMENTEIQFENKCNQIEVEKSSHKTTVLYVRCSSVGMRKISISARLCSSDCSASDESIPNACCSCSLNLAVIHMNVMQSFHFEAKLKSLETFEDLSFVSRCRPLLLQCKFKSDTHDQHIRLSNFKLTMNSSLFSLLDDDEEIETEVLLHSHSEYTMLFTLTSNLTRIVDKSLHVGEISFDWVRNNSKSKMQSNSIAFDITCSDVSIPAASISPLTVCLNRDKLLPSHLCQYQPFTFEMNILNDSEVIQEVSVDLKLEKSDDNNTASFAISGPKFISMLRIFPSDNYIREEFWEEDFSPTPIRFVLYPLKCGPSVKLPNIHVMDGQGRLATSALPSSICVLPSSSAAATVEQKNEFELSLDSRPTLASPVVTFESRISKS